MACKDVPAFVRVKTVCRGLPPSFCPTGELMKFTQSIESVLTTLYSSQPSGDKETSGFINLANWL